MRRSENPAHHGIRTCIGQRQNEEEKHGESAHGGGFRHAGEENHARLDSINQGSQEKEGYRSEEKEQSIEHHGPHLLRIPAPGWLSTELSFTHAMIQGQ